MIGTVESKRILQTSVIYVTSDSTYAPFLCTASYTKAAFSVTVLNDISASQNKISIKWESVEI